MFVNGFFVANVVQKTVPPKSCKSDWQSISNVVF